MQFIDILRALRRYWRTVAVSIAIALAFGFGATALMPKTYVSVTQHFVQTSGSGTIAELQQGEVFAQARAQSYAAIVNTPLALQPVIDELGLDLTVEEFSEMVTVSVRPATVIFSVGVEAPTATEAARRTAAVGAQIRKSISQLERVAGTDTQTVSLVTLTEATFPTAPSSPALGMNLAAAFLLGAIIGSAAALIKYRNLLNAWPRTIPSLPEPQKAGKRT